MPGKPKAPAELDFLASLEQGNVVTQARLSKRIDASVGLVNALLKRAMSKGFVKAKSAPYKRYAYYLTPRGFAEKSRLVVSYLESSLSFFRAARQEYSELFTRARSAGKSQVILAGSGDLAEIAMLAAREAEMEIVAVLDRGRNAGHFHGIPIVRTLGDLGPDTVVALTDACAPQETFDILMRAIGDQRLLVPNLLRITRVPLDFKPKLGESGPSRRGGR